MQTKAEWLEEHIEQSLAHLETLSNEDLLKEAANMLEQELRLSSMFNEVDQWEVVKIKEYLNISDSSYDKSSELLGRARHVVEIVKRVSDWVTKERIVMQQLATFDPVCYAQVILYRRSHYRDATLGEYTKSCLERYLNCGSDCEKAK